MKKDAVFPMHGKAALLRPHIPQNNIRPDTADAVPGDAVIILAAHKAQYSAWPRHDQGADLSFRNFHFDIRYKAQPPPI